MNTLHTLSAPSPWLVRWSDLIKPGARVLDVACGSGRHLQWFAQRGCVVTGVDRDIASARQAISGAALIEADMEQGPWPLMDGGQPTQFDAVVVTNYLWRPLMATLIQSLAPGGVLLYETFASGNETVGRPARPDFLLRDGELLEICGALRVIAYENGFLAAPERFVQRIAAVRNHPQEVPGAPPVRYAL